MIETMIASAVIPAGIELLKRVVGGLSDKFLGNVRPQTLDDVIRLRQSDVEYAKAMAELDKPTGDISTWVANLRASYRYIAGTVVILGGIGIQFVTGISPTVASAAWEAVNVVFGFFFGDRIMVRLANK